MIGLLAIVWGLVCGVWWWAVRHWLWPPPMTWTVGRCAWYDRVLWAIWLGSVLCLGLLYGYLLVWSIAWASTAAC